MNGENLRGIQGISLALGAPCIASIEKAKEGELTDRSTVPSPEVSERPTRRKFPAEYRLRILELADACSGPGRLGALLRREGLYHSNVKTWRRQRDQGMFSALQPKKRGRKEIEQNPLQPELDRLLKENERLRNRLKQAQIILDIQKKASQLLGIPLESPPQGEGS